MLKWFKRKTEVKTEAHDINETSEKITSDSIENVCDASEPDTHIIHKVFGDLDVNSPDIINVIQNISDDEAFDVMTCDDGVYLDVMLNNRIISDELVYRLVEWDYSENHRGYSDNSAILRQLIETQPFNTKTYNLFIHENATDSGNPRKFQILPPSAKQAYMLIVKYMKQNASIMEKIDKYFTNKFGKAIEYTPSNLYTSHEDIVLTRQELIEISRDPNVPFEAVIFFMYKLNMYWISRNNGVDIVQIPWYPDLLDFEVISQYRELSEDFIANHKGRLNVKLICEYQTLSNDFLMEYYNWVDWLYVSLYQDLSAETIRAHHNRIDIDNLLKNKNIALSDIQIREIYEDVHGDI